MAEGDVKREGDEEEEEDLASLSGDEIDRMEDESEQSLEPIKKQGKQRIHKL